MIYLQISTAQGPAECQMFARFALQKILREAEAADAQAEILEETPSKHGILSAVLKLSGNRAESLAAGWQGTLQWVCPSPLRPQHPRKNWYIGVFRLPEIPALPESEGIEFQTCRAGGKGGQHVNKTESAVRITHAPTGIVVQCQNDRSQHKNKATAMKMLKSRLYELELMKQQEAAGSIEKSEIGWGHQIRSYVLFPYQQVKDNRSGEAYSQTDAILDGDIKKLIEGVLVSQKSIN